MSVLLENANRFPVTGTIFVSRNCTAPVNTGITVTIPSGSCCSAINANLVVNQCDRLSVQVNTAGNNALTDGAAATIILS